MNAEASNLTLTATDLDLMFIHKIENVEITEDENYNNPVNNL